MKLNIISDDEFECSNKSEGKQTSTTSCNSYQKKIKVSSKQGINSGKTKTSEPARKSKRLPYPKQIGKLGGVPYYTNNNKTNPINNGNLLQEKITATAEASEENDYRTIRQDDKEIRSKRSHGKTQQTFTGPLRRGDMTCYYRDLYRRLHTNRSLRT